MKKFALLVALALSSAAVAEDHPIETLTLSTASAVSTAKKVTAQVSLSCTGEIRYKTCQTAACTSEGDITASTGTRLTNFDLPVDICILNSGGSYLRIIRTGGASITCDVAKVVPKTICR